MFSGGHQIKGERIVNTAGQGICYIIGAGVFGDGVPSPASEDLVIACDKGFQACEERGIRVDLVIGDFDSLGFTPKHDHVIVLPVVKDDTDTRAAALEGWNRGYRSFVFYGGTGGRISHTIANIQMMSDLVSQGAECRMIGEETRYTVIHNGEFEILPDRRGIISVFCLGGVAEGVSIHGLKYELERAILNSRYPLGVSNEYLGRPGKISVEHGTLLIIEED